jgi:hypothetical protein
MFISVIKMKDGSNILKAVRDDNKTILIFPFCLAQSNSVKLNLTYKFYLHNAFVCVKNDP